MAKDKIEIIHQGEQILIINKPTGVSVTKDRTGKPDITALLSKHKDIISDDLRPVHRLDKAVSGIMLIAKTPQAQSHYASMFEKQKIRDRYLVLVKGFVSEQSGVVKMPIDHSKRVRGTMYIAPRRGKEAITEWQLLADFGLVSLIKASPLTCRSHQIRVHFQHIGLPLAIDPLYGGTSPVMLSDFKQKYTGKPGQPEKPLIERLTLHAYQLEIPAENGFEGGVFTAGLDRKFLATIKMISRHNPQKLDAFIEPDIYKKILAAEPI